MTAATGNPLVKYEAARAALQAAHDVDEVKDIRDKAQAMAAYAKQANDTALVEWATEIKVRAERKAGEMLAEMERHPGKRTDRTSDHDGPRSLKEVLEANNIAPTTAKRWQKLAAVPDEQFEQAVEAAKEVAGEVTTAALLRSPRTSDHDGPRLEAQPQKGQKSASDDAEKVRAELSDLQGKYADLLEKNAELADVAQELNDKLEAFSTTEPDEQQKLIANLQLKLRKKDAEIDRQRVQLRDANNENNALKREVKKLQRRLGIGQ